MVSKQGGREGTTARGHGSTCFAKAGRLAAALALLTSLAVPAAQGGEDSVLIGARVRIRTVEPGPMRVGTLLSRTSDELVVRVEAAELPVAFRRGDVALLEVSRGVHRNTLKGLLAGAVVFGVVVGGVAAFDTLDESGVGEPAFLGGLLATGAGIGALVKTETWRPVPKGSVSIAPGPRGRGAGLQFTVTF